jgi:hypothetical protein
MPSTSRLANRGSRTMDGRAHTTGATAAREWTAHVDPDSGVTYFHNTVTGESSWEAPPGLDRADSIPQEGVTTPVPAGHPPTLFAPWQAAAPGWYTEGPAPAAHAAVPAPFELEPAEPSVHYGAPAKSQQGSIISTINGPLTRDRPGTSSVSRTARADSTSQQRPGLVGRVQRLFYGDDAQGGEPAADRETAAEPAADGAAADDKAKKPASPLDLLAKPVPRLWGGAMRAVICGLAVGLLWCTTLNISRGIAVLFIPSPDTRVIFESWKTVSAVAQVEHNGHISCAETAARLCQMQQDATVAAALNATSGRTHNLQVATDIGNAASECVSAVKVVFTEVADWIAADVQHTLNWTGACSDDEEAQLLQALGAGEAGARSTSYSVSKQYVDNNNNTWNILQAQMEARAKYDRDYLANKTALFRALVPQIGGLPDAYFRAAVNLLNVSVPLPAGIAIGCITNGSYCPTQSIVDGYRVSPHRSAPPSAGTNGNRSWAAEGAAHAERYLRGDRERASRRVRRHQCLPGLHAGPFPRHPGVCVCAGGSPFSALSHTERLLVDGQRQQCHGANRCERAAACRPRARGDEPLAQASTWATCHSRRR